MGVTVRNKHRSYDMGSGGFMRFRLRIAKLCSKEFGEHYDRLCSPEGMRADKAWYDEFDRETERLIKEKLVNIKVVDFCLQSDCGGKITYGACKVIYSFIEGYNDDIIYGYPGKENPTMFADLKALIKECADEKIPLSWN